MKKISLILCLSLLTSILPSSVLAQSMVFSDVTDENLKLDAIEYLKEEGVIQGYGDGTFKPNNRINRAEFTKIVISSLYDEEEINTCSYESQSYPDVDMDSWYAPFVCVATREGIVAGYPDGTFRPSDYINFAESSKIIANSFGLEFKQSDESEDLWYANFVGSLEANSAIPSTIDSPGVDLTRGDMSEIVYRIKAGVSDKPTQTLSNLTSQVGTINSCSALSERFQEHNYTPYYYLSEPMMMDDMEESNDMGAGDSAVSMEAGSGYTEDMTKYEFSETNIQEAGVDEPDVVKTNGTHIYTINSDYRSPAVQVVKTNSGDMELESSILFNNSTPSGIFLKDDKLIVLTSSNFYHYYPIPLLEGSAEDDFQILDSEQSLDFEEKNSTNQVDFEVTTEALSLPDFRDSSQTEMYIFDVSDTTSPNLIKKASVEGSYQNARLIDDQLIFVSSYYPYYYNFDDLEGEDLIPQASVDGSDFAPVVDCTDIKYLPNHSGMSFLTLSTLDTSDASAQLSSEVLIASSSDMYVSPDHIYLTQPKYNYSWYSDFEDQEEVTTNVFKFNIDGSGTEFEGVMSVPGTPLNQFSMSEYEGTFRIATTLEDWSDWENVNSTNNLYIFDDNLNRIGALEGLAKGERIYSVRFIGERAYMVTFRQIDPFFVIDLSNSNQPKVLGELKIPGFSDYLHPYDENHILGFGQDADLDGRAQGMKVALFNVEDPTNPIELHSYQIGDRGTSSELLYNHKALLFSKSKNIIAFPVSINVSDDKDSWGTLSFVGALNLGLDLEEGFTIQGKYSHLTDGIDPDNVWNYNYNEDIKRLIYIDDNIYTISNKKIQSHPISSNDTIDSVTLINN